MVSLSSGVKLVTCAEGILPSTSSVGRTKRSTNKAEVARSGSDTIQGQAVLYLQFGARLGFLVEHCLESGVTVIDLEHPL